ncbi:uncharacterized protein LOC124688897 isoform X2 [Lolium rigidum]|uniref:uncharacterized protein LOC124688897 isoform X2 n=1 Tax=Lolium rigidum TaxID=89674 RepID=UPI001F5D917C|nr:uncharacterized protein LOC124688897 isoform X2 [Lolium rigidum]XP_047078474.1 uncharacterized protein LOC124688897 isoform X2 [Lolium rigidum]
MESSSDLRCLCSMCNLAGRTQLLYLATLKSMVHGQHMACLISSLHMDNIFKAKVLEDLQDSGSSTTEPKAQEAWQKLPYVLDGKNCYAQKFKKPGKNYQLHSIQHLLLIGVAWFRETIRSYPFFRMYPRKTSGVSEYYRHAILLHAY